MLNLIKKTQLTRKVMTITTCSVARVWCEGHSVTGRTIGCVTLLRLNGVSRTHGTGSTGTTVVTSVTL